MWVKSMALRALWMSVSPDDAARMIELLDTDHDGQISLDELRSFVYLLPEAQVPALTSWPGLHPQQRIGLRMQPRMSCLLAHACQSAGLAHTSTTASMR